MKFQLFLILLLLTAAMLLGTACTSVGTAAVGEAAADAAQETTLSRVQSQAPDCPVTKPPDPPFIPPDPWPAQPPSVNQFWFGESGLWTALPVDGSWGQLARGEKFWWWSAEFDVSVDSTPDLILTAKRLDGEAPALQLSEATNGYHESFHWAMLMGVELAAPGCWEFTGQYQGHQLSFVLWVPAE